MSITVAGFIKSPAIIDALEELEINKIPMNKTSVIIWTDEYRETKLYDNLNPWQIINRIPQSKFICGKAFFTKIVQIMHYYFPTFYNFIPNTYILPYQVHLFKKKLDESKFKNESYIIKSNGGSCGFGISIIDPGQLFTISQKLTVAQKYISSYLLDGYKFDIRVYALVIAGDPPTIFIYKNGVVRICSSLATNNSKYARLTNVALNKHNPQANLQNIEKSLDGLFLLLSEQGVDVKSLWNEIKRIITLSVLGMAGVFIPAYTQILNPSENKIWPRAFQLFGFDVLLDENARPWILEVNQRPSMFSITNEEHRLKVNMIKELFGIIAPSPEVENAVASDDQTFEYVKMHPEYYRLPRSIGNFERVFGTFSLDPSKPVNEFYTQHFKLFSDVYHLSRKIFRPLLCTRILPWWPLETLKEKLSKEYDQTAHFRPSFLKSKEPLLDLHPVKSQDQIKEVPLKPILHKSSCPQHFSNVVPVNNIDGKVNNDGSDSEELRMNDNAFDDISEINFSKFQERYQSGEVEMATRYALCLILGIGTKADPKKAIEVLIQATDQKDFEAIELLDVALSKKTKIIEDTPETRTKNPLMLALSILKFNCQQMISCQHVV